NLKSRLVESAVAIAQVRRELPGKAPRHLVRRNVRKRLRRNYPGPIRSTKAPGDRIRDQQARATSLCRRARAGPRLPLVAAFLAMLCETRDPIPARRDLIRLRDRRKRNVRPLFS